MVSSLASALFALAGCGTGTFTTANVANVATATSETIPGVPINGHVHGAAYPIQNATVILMETQSNGTWTASTNNYVGTAKALYATTSNSLGSFSFPDTGWSCDSGQYLYIEVTGGKTANASGSNANVVQLGVVGSCAGDLANKAEIDGINVFLSEPSTVAVAYALRSFISTHNGTLSGVTNDGTPSTTTTIPLVDITSAYNNNAIPAFPGLNTGNHAPGPVQVTFASTNITAITTDGTGTSTGLDGAGNTYSSNLLGTTLTYAGVPYTFGAANTTDAVQNLTVALPHGYFNTLNILGAGSNGNQAAASFVVTYTDGTTTTFSQGVSDWYTPQKYTGEATAATFKYRNNSAGAEDVRNFNLYQYTFTLDPTKSIASVKLPPTSGTKNFGAIAMTLVSSNAPVCSGVRTGTALNCTAAGLTHGFQNAFNLVDQVTFSASQFPSGQARIALPGNSATVAPAQMLNTLGNILQSCVDSTGGTVGTYSSYVPGGSGSTRCGDLFYYTTPSGGTPPTNTLQAALNMANYPRNNVSSLFALQPRAVFFTPDMVSQPSALTVSVFYKGTDKGDTFSAPADLALDVQDNVYVAYGTSTNATLDELTSAGTGVFTQSLSGVAATPKSVAVDLNNYVWVTDDTANASNSGNAGGVTGLYTSLSAGSGTTAGSTYKHVNLTGGAAAGLAFDASSNMLVTRDSSDANATAYVLTATSTYGSGTSYTLNHPFQHVAVDNKGDFYGVGTTGASTEGAFFPYASCGSTYAPATATENVSNGVSIAVNNSTGSGQNYAFAPVGGQVISVNAGGTCGAMYLQSPANSYTNSSINTPAGVAMDGGLNLFWTDNATGLIYELASIGNSTNISTASAVSFAPCYISGGACASTTSAKFSGMVVDSSGAMWYLSNGGTYGLVQTLGMADPTVPLLAAEDSGTTVQ